MIPLLAAAALSCNQGAWILEGINQLDIPIRQNVELTIEILKSMPDDCAGRYYAGKPDEQ